jgi:hypothetical protein
MQLNSFVRRALPVSVAAGLLLAGAIGQTRTTSANASEPPTCSNRTIRGDYGSTFEGAILLPSPAPSLRLRGLALGHFDGHGNYSEVAFVTLNGVPEESDWRPATGTYEVNPDCTGTQEIHFNNGSPSLKLRFVIVDGGRQMMSNVEGNPIGGIGIKVR